MRHFLRGRCFTSSRSLPWQFARALLSCLGGYSRVDHTGCSRSDSFTQFLELKNILIPPFFCMDTLSFLANAAERPDNALAHFPLAYLYRRLTGLYLRTDP